jgi:hypothetical protein
VKVDVDVLVRSFVKICPSASHYVRRTTHTCILYPTFLYKIRSECYVVFLEIVSRILGGIRYCRAVQCRKYMFCGVSRTCPACLAIVTARYNTTQHGSRQTAFARPCVWVVLIAQI